MAGDDAHIGHDRAESLNLAAADVRRAAQCATIRAVNLRSDVVGSLLRPDYLRHAHAQLERGELTPAACKQVEDRAVDEAVAMQQQAGLDVVTDGEMRRYAFYGHLVEALEGFDKYSGWSITFRDGDGREAACSVRSPLETEVAPPQAVE